MSIATVLRGGGGGDGGEIHKKVYILLLHWLPVSFRIQLKNVLIVYKALRGQAPSYVSDIFSFNSSPKSLRSANKALLYVPRSRLQFKGDRVFAVAA